jgi:hypothetical protein
VPTLILEVVASHDLRIWDAFFGVAGSNNDINVLNQAPLFFDALKGEVPQVHFSVNGNEYITGYYLADGIYPKWVTFMKTIMLACVILHNMIVEDERDDATIHIDLNENPGTSFVLPSEVSIGGNLCFTDVLCRKASIHDRPQHTQLKNDLVEHIWHRFGNNHNN